MTPDDYRAILASLGLSQASAARLLGVGEVTSRRWATGARPVPAVAERFLRYLQASKTKPEKVLRLLEVKGT